MNDFQNLKGIIFDYGGTIDSRGDHWSEVIYDRYLAANAGIDYDIFSKAYVHAERALAKERYVMPNYNFREMMLRKIYLQLDWLIMNSHMDLRTGERVYIPIVDGCYDFAKRAVAEAKPCLEKLAARYPLVLVSNFYGNMDEVLRDFGIRSLFKGIVESAVIGIRKPDPRIFRVGCIVLDLDPSEVLVVGDSLAKDIRPAMSIGCKTAWISGRQWRGDSIPADAPQSYTLAALAEILQDRNCG